MIVIDEEKLDVARALLRAGSSYTTAAAKAGMHKMTLRKYVPGYPVRPVHVFTAEEIATVERLLADGCSLAECARTIGANVGSVTQRWRGRGWDRQTWLDYLLALRKFDAENRSKDFTRHLAGPHDAESIR